MLANYVAHFDLYTTEGAYFAGGRRKVDCDSKVVSNSPRSRQPNYETHIAKRQTPQQFIIFWTAHTSKDEIPKKEGEN
jgi:hypothetical protein